MSTPISALNLTHRSIYRAGLFDGKVVIVSGGGSGIGRCTAHEPASLGASVALVGRTRDKLDAICATIAHGDINVSQNSTAAVKQDGPWWIGRVEEFPGVNCQERTRDELVESLRVTLKEALKMNRTHARDAAGKGCEALSIAV